MPRGRRPRRRPRELPRGRRCPGRLGSCHRLPPRRSAPLSRLRRLRDDPEARGGRSPEVHERYDIIASGRSEGIGGAQYYGYQDDLCAQVLASFDSLGVPVDRDRVQLHRGLFDATLKPSGAVAFAHIDCDWHDPARLCLDRIYPHLSPGAWVVADDYFVYGGARRAIDDFVAVHADVTVVPTRAREHLVLRRTGPTLNA